MNDLPKNFWFDNVSKTDGKHNIDPDAWGNICKIRHSPIILIRDKHLGEDNKPHMVIPKDYKGYIIVYPEAFYLSDKDLIDIHTMTNCLNPDDDRVPAWFFGVGLVFLHKQDYKIIPPYFDMGLANYGYSNAINS